MEFLSSVCALVAEMRKGYPIQGNFFEVFWEGGEIKENSVFLWRKH